MSNEQEISEYNILKQRLLMQINSKDRNEFITTLEQVKKSVGVYRKLGGIMMIIGVPMLILVIGLVVIPAGIFMHRYGKAQEKKYDRFIEMAKTDNSLTD